ncbi:thiamine phosphate synthase [Persicirhabdus sediminis]|uniref:Thiamine-phosphate synthase n=1 Tax=Persicirhabdus sediminis TaxID=454144 RepID=A0A8J7SLD5_9BACT|nr:thiamine phosphate synthase [Persicirhabdus sediminis]MBK1790323.1 thiamine phosphate synthase [Persicirhabdus sediminis]
MSQTVREKLAAATLYGIVDLGYVNEDSLELRTQQLIDGGAGVIQLRAKGCELDKILKFSQLVGSVCRQAGVPFIVNDFADIAKQVSADGVHIGQDDGTLAAVREIVGGEMIVGRSTHSPEQAAGALAEGFDYIGFGPLFPTPTKKGRPGIGMENIVGVQQSVGAEIPVFCIGGIVPSNLAEVIDAGARRVVIVSALLTAEDVVGTTRACVDQLKDLNS